MAYLCDWYDVGRKELTERRKEKGGPTSADTRLITLLTTHGIKWVNSLSGTVTCAIQGKLII